MDRAGLDDRRGAPDRRAGHPARPAGGGSRPLVIGLLILWRVLRGFASPVYNVNQVSLRQRITPDRLLGRMNA
ncbi:MAG TPA: hypothetical protein VMU89_01920, partial [Thermomicrobiaceae bacterium]|nr:hypothetical protein [Thermomicrobiaceae bacterium]